MALGITGAPRCQLLDASQQADREARTAGREQRCARGTGLAWALFTRPGSRTPGVGQGGHTRVSTHQLSRYSTSRRKPPWLVTMPPCHAVDPQEVRKQWSIPPEEEGGAMVPFPKAIGSKVLNKGVP